MISPISFVIIGSGGIADFHAHAISVVPGARLVAVWGQVPDQATAFAQKHGVEFISDIGSLAARKDIHAVTIATPSGTHEQFALPFLREGKAVLCEKPLDVRLDKIDHLLATARDSRAILAGVFQLRLAAGAQAMKRAVEQGRFGRLTLCSAYLKWWRDQAYYDAVDWRGTRELDGGGALMNQGIHVVDLLQWLVGMPSEVNAISACLAHQRIEVEDTIVVNLRYPNGALGVIEAATSCKPGFHMRIEICGDQGSAILENDRITFWQFEVSRPDDEVIRAGQSGLIQGGTSDPKAISIEGHRRLIEDLVGAIRDNRPPLIPGTEARDPVRLVLAAYESAVTGRTVKL
jgi:UDP-N-acetyl-2-amino-2-deoxyglucuronate dehydrogenase